MSQSFQKAAGAAFVWVCCAAGTIVTGGCANNDELGDARGGTSSTNGSGGAGNSAPGSGGGGATVGGPEICTDGADNDGDDLSDCEDADCADQVCDEAAGLTCRAGGCVPEGVFENPLPSLAGIHSRVRGDTVFVGFEPVANARDYRIYVLPNPDDISVDADGYQTVQNAIYRCAGDRAVPTIESDVSGEVHFYERGDDESLLGHVYLFDGDGRVPVYQLGSPDPRSDTVSGTSFSSTRVRTFTTSSSERDAMLADGWRDDGIAFFAPESGDRTVYRYRSEPQGYSQNRRFILLVNEGPELTYRQQDDSATLDPLFETLAEPDADSVPLRRTLYKNADIHDVIAAGDADWERIRVQGNQPVWELMWAGLEEKTTLVIEALDQGCAFVDHLAYENIDATDHTRRYRTLEQMQADSETGEVYINAQFDSANRPVPIARSFVTVSPEPAPEMDFFADFNSGWEAFDKLEEDGNNGNIHFTSPTWDVDWSNVQNKPPVWTVGPILGELWMAMADRGSGVNGRFRIAPRELASIANDQYLHVTMEVDISSTGRRYPQVMISSLPAPIQFSLEEGTTIVVQTFGNSDLQVQFCDHRTWDVNNQCPRMPLTKDKTSDPWSTENQSRLWTPVHPVAEFSGYNQRPRIDIYTSTEKVYVYFDGAPYGCAILPSGKFSAGDVSVNWGAVLYHSGIDEDVVQDNAPQQYLKRFSLTQTSRHFDNLGFDSGVSLPEWSEHIPCLDGPWQ